MKKSQVDKITFNLIVNLSLSYLSVSLEANQAFCMCNINVFIILNIICSRIYIFLFFVMIFILVIEDLNSSRSICEIMFKDKAQMTHI